MIENYRKMITGIIVVTILIVLEIALLTYKKTRSLKPESIPKQYQPSKISRVSFLAFGDINLGRTIGQKILKIGVAYPFEKYNIREDSSDIVFANLECQISFQNGETGHPKYNLVFTAPPEATTTLQHSGVDIVSTANNHALDYGYKALGETIENLKKANILFVGTSNNEKTLFDPLIIEKNNIKIAIFAVTSFVNIALKDWKKSIASPDTIVLKTKIAQVRSSVDIVILSYHGGVEYIDTPIKKVRDFAKWSIENDVDIFLGHHPHVTYGVEKKGKKFIVHSLGNFVFYQPQHYWTQRGYGLKFIFEKNDSVTSIDIQKFYPLNVSLQTKRLNDSTELAKLFNRTQQLSNIDLTPYWK
ncbi:MAG: CapA family protein [Bacteroidota bacterium]|nr:CapA family protein [Bacteroidota bacterium]